ncbi:MAG: TfoX/Sxy family protein [Caldilineaceae bacterium]
MAYNETLAQRIRSVMPSTDIVEKKMFGGLAFMVNGNMCCGIVKDTLMARVGPEQHGHMLTLPHARPMDFTGRPSKGMIYVYPPGIASDEDLRTWVNRCLAFVETLPGKL